MSDDFGPTGIDPDWYDNGPGSENYILKRREEERAYEKKCWEERRAENNRVAGLDAEIAKLRKALEEIRSATCPMGIDWGDSGVHKLACDALAEKGTDDDKTSV